VKFGGVRFMIWQSIWAMTVIDLAVIGMIAYTLAYFINLRDRILLPSTRYGLLAIGFGLLVIAIFYAVDLAAMHLLPVFMAEPDAMEFMRELHNQFNWFIPLISVGAISFGLLVNARGLLRLVTALRQSEERFREFAESSSDWFWEMGPDLRFTYISESLFEATGFHAEDRIGARREDFVSVSEIQRHPEKWVAHRADLAARRPFKGFEYDSQATLGGVSISGRPFFDADGEFLGYRGTGTDITERKRAELALRRSEELQRAITDHSPSVIYLKDTESRYLKINPAFEKIYGVTEAQTLGNQGYEWMDRKVLDSLIGLDQKVIESKIPLESEFEITHSHGVKSNLHSIKFPVSDQQGNIIGIGGISTDITERKHLEEALRQSQKMEAVGQLTGGVAHDFNNLLAAIMTNAQLLELSLEDQDDLLVMVRSIVRESQRGAELTHRLLAFSRRQTLQPKSIELGVLCDGMIDLLQRSLGETIEIDITSGDNPWNVLADPGEVESALLNLAINAKHAMPTGGKLEVRIENASVTDREWAELWNGRPGEYVALAVIDHGTGMPKQVLDHVFEPFFSTKGVGQGSGLGLSMVHGFAQQSGGFTAIESEEGRGTTITIYLPKTQLVQKTLAARKVDSELQMGLGETILLVEDEPAVRQITTNMLDRLGYTVVTAKDGVEALSVVSNADRIDLLLSDIVLPGGMNGIEVYENIRRQWPEIACLFMSGYSSLPDHQLPEGTELLPKPIRLSDFANKIRLVLDA
jgi:PAS domain S-box-containing protein